ncbi:MAG: hypothetical protein IKZ06_01970 [Oscillospiraceae bacterium]|nr:hypothetical protein [Oscillospiraceae bacterium]
MKIETAKSTVGNGLDRSVFENNPSVTFGDSSLYTREPYSMGRQIWFKSCKMIHKATDKNLLRLIATL